MRRVREQSQKRQSEKRREERRSKKRKSQERRCRCERKVGKSRNIVKRRLPKAAGAEPCGQMRDEKFQAVVGRSFQGPSSFASGDVELWREANFQVNSFKKHAILGPCLEVEMLKKCTMLWREARFQVKMCKAHQSRTTFGS